MTNCWGNITLKNERVVVNMREKFQRFMYGRYGFDELSKLHLIVVIVCMVASMLLDNSC